MDLLVTFIIFFAIDVGDVLSDDTYETAKCLYKQTHRTSLKLYWQYNIPPTDYAASEKVEVIAQTNSSAHIKADILLEYLQLEKYKHHDDKYSMRKNLQGYVSKLRKSAYCLKQPKCNPNAKYRRNTGICNNLKYPNMGAERSNKVRILKPWYDDGIHSFRRARSNDELPNPRKIGNILKRANDKMRFSPENYSDEVLASNFAGFMYGQFFSHDMAGRIPTQMIGNNANGFRCCSSSYDSRLPPEITNPNCVPVELPRDDYFYANKSIFCQNYIRLTTTLDVKCEFKYVQPENIASSYLDLTPIYFGDGTATRGIRLNRSGLFNLYKDIFPRINGKFQIPDGRFHQTTMLAVYHSLFFRNHNFLAKGLAKVKPHWDDERLFKESRRISEAIQQSIVYNEWLPKYFGDSLTSKMARCKDYDPNVDATQAAEFVFTSFRFYHQNIPPTVHFTDENNVTSEMRLSDTFNNLDPLKTNYTELLRGLSRQNLRVNELGYDDEMRNLLFQSKFRGERVGLDIMIFDIMRSRDSGMPPYHKFYEFCLSIKIKSWDDFAPYFKPYKLELMKSMYESYSDIDPIIGMLLEEPVYNFVGEIGACVQGEQFYRTKCGDRFFYTHPSNPYPFTPEQIKEIEAVDFTKLHCMLTDIGQMPRSGMLVPSKENPLIDCKQLLEQKPFNFDVFRID